MKTPLQASILAIGTELTTGQITNRNAPWISHQLVDLQVEVVLHETVPDDRSLILGALNRCREVSQLIFVTGGLGPTSDDFTRDVIAEWLASPLQFHESSWTKIETRLAKLSIPNSQSNRQQCFFPAGTEILPNDQGTADAFYCHLDGGVALDHGETSDGHHLWVLPGPPREIEAIWKSSIDMKLRALVPAYEPVRLLTWQCIGKSEAALGELTEKIFSGSQLQLGYRATRPYVEIKVWCPENAMSENQARFDQLERAIAPWLVTRQGEDLARTLLKALEGAKFAEEIEMIDAATAGGLNRRLSELLSKKEFSKLANNITLVTEWVNHHAPHEWVTQLLEEADPQPLTLVVAGFTEDGDWALGMKHGDFEKHALIPSMFKSSELIDRNRGFAAELALKHWREWLKQC